ncbi:rRNA-binding ribosome biosynthesis protein rpf2 [Conglomerata obtusa]
MHSPLAKEKRKPLLLLSVCKASKSLLSPLTHLHPNVTSMHLTSPILEKMASHNLPLSIAATIKTLVITRTFNNEHIDTHEFSIVSSSPLINFELNSRYITALIGLEGRLENAFIDLFACKGREAIVDSLTYVLVIECRDSTYIISLERDGKKCYELVLELVRADLCDDDFYKQACERKREKKVKNVSKSEMGDVVGKLHLEKQDLKEIQIKKPRRVKHVTGTKIV